MHREDLKLKIRDFARSQKPFFLILNFEANGGYLYSLDELQQESITILFPHFQHGNNEILSSPIELSSSPMPFETYQQGFNIVMKHLRYGNSFLTNFTCETPIQTEASLQQIYASVQAKYKIQFQEDWVCFSPETFIQIKNQQLFSFPMKGTIDASLPDAEQQLLSDEKEMAEHYTIVDLLRNDMSVVGHHVRVNRFRYIDTIHTRGKNLLQMSSEIVADLPSDYLHRLDDIIFSMLPAGSISGAPKQKTLDIIHEAEGYQRGFYTGTAYYFDGKDLDSCVLIRFIEQQEQQFVYKSGGGITTQSEAEKEYQEMLDKIYIPSTKNS